VEARYSKLDLLKDHAHINGIPDVICIFLCVVFSLYLVVRIINMYQVREKYIYFLFYGYHLFITLYYYVMTKSAFIRADAAKYYLRIIYPQIFYDPTIKFGLASNFIKSIVYVLYTYFNLSYLSCFILFSTFGWTGFYLFLSMAKKTGFSIRGKWLGVYIFPLLLFLPNQHMWTVALGKDSLAFFAIMLTTYSLTNFRKNILVFLFGITLIFFLRPHVCIMFILALFFTLMIWGEFTNLVKVPVLILVSSIGYVVFTIFLDKVFGTVFTVSNVIEIIEGRQGYYAENDYGGSTVDTSRYPFLFKMFSYLYRPIFEQINFNFIMVGIDNLIALFFTLSIFTKGFFRFLNSAPFYVKFSLIFFLVGTIFFASIFSNFGIAVRQKTMFMYSLYVVIVSFSAWKTEFYRRPIYALS